MAPLEVPHERTSKLFIDTMNAKFSGADEKGQATCSVSRRLRGRIPLSDPAVIEEIAESDGSYKLEDIPSGTRAIFDSNILVY
jgi:hypothetical protein